MVDTPALGAGRGNPVKVQVLSTAPVDLFFYKKESVMSQEAKDEMKIGQILLHHYQALGCQSIITLIQYLLSPNGEKLVSLGSSTLGLSEILKRSDLNEKEKMILAENHCYKLHLGSRHTAETPLQTLFRYTEELKQTNALLLPKNNNGVHKISLRQFDVICGELIHILLQTQKSLDRELPKSTVH